MLRAISINEVVRFTLPDDKESPTVFLIKNITHDKKIELFSDPAKMMSNAIPTLIAGLKGIENLDGKNYDVITAEVLELVPFAELPKVMNAVVDFNMLGAVETKN